jgi:hypothetical protein
VNALVPCLIAVMLAEIGNPLAALALRRMNSVAFILCLLVVTAVGAGWSLAPLMNDQARVMMLALALGFAATGQVWRGKPANDTWFGGALTLWRSPAPFLAFGFAIWDAEPVGPALGAIMAVAAVTAGAASGIILPPVTRIVAAALLFVAALVALLTALRLIG